MYPWLFHHVHECLDYDLVMMETCSGWTSWPKFFVLKLYMKSSMDRHFFTSRPGMYTMSGMHGVKRHGPSDLTMRWSRGWKNFVMRGEISGIGGFHFQCTSFCLDPHNQDTKIMHVMFYLSKLNHLIGLLESSQTYLKVMFTMHFSNLLPRCHELWGQMTSLKSWVWTFSVIHVGVLPQWEDRHCTSFLPMIWLLASICVHELRLHKAHGSYLFYQGMRMKNTLLMSLFSNTRSVWVLVNHCNLCRTARPAPGWMHSIYLMCPMKGIHTAWEQMRPSLYLELYPLTLMRSRRTCIICGVDKLGNGQMRHLQLKFLYGLLTMLHQCHTDFIPVGCACGLTIPDALVPSSCYNWL